MADRTTNIVQQLLNRVEDLSQSILSASNESENNGLNEEVNRVFGRSNRTGSSQQSQENNVNASRPTASTSTATHYQRAVAPRYQMPRNLTRRQASINRATTQRPKASNNRNKTPFMRDLILLAGPKDTVVPRQGSKLLLIEHGHVITACQFRKDMNPAQVLTEIAMAFGEKLLDVDIEILMSVHSSLVVPTLAPGQDGIDGVILHRLFKEKPVYVRPDRQLINPVSKNNKHFIN
jgi:hypothetical protein